jgi:hypothetical protein
MSKSARFSGDHPALPLIQIRAEGIAWQITLLPTPKALRLWTELQILQPHDSAPQKRESPLRSKALAQLDTVLMTLESAAEKSPVD